MRIEELLRENIKNLQPYSCARDEFKGEASVYLDANENPYNAPFNRYPDPLQIDVKKRLAKLKNVPVENIFLGNGSDEPIDLLYRAFCEPKEDNVVAIEPTYGMYKVCASVNDVDYRKVLLNSDYDIEAYRLLDACNARTKIIWLCSPNNPTGNNLNVEEVLKTLKWFRGIVVVDEAYIDFSSNKSYSSYLKIFPNLVILQTLSKAWGSAAIRLGMAYASEEIIQVLNKIKYPYNINVLTQKQAISILTKPARTQKWVAGLLAERSRVIEQLKQIQVVKQVYRTDANFVLVKVDDANYIYKDLVGKGIIVRNRHNVTLCNDCLRITIGTPEENGILISELKKY
ncbi:MAG: histidinol phosphate aminotransferase apoenzyme [Bacteroidetes bacterium]|nr:histidinol phosphate aminotransferase apoenzyme [Bacteroidota bacterium]